MGLWLSLSEWFGDIPSHGVLFKRSMINGVGAIGLVFVLMLLGAPADYAVVVIVGMFVVNGVMFSVYQRQRNRTPE